MERVRITQPRPMASKIIVATAITAGAQSFALKWHAVPTSAPEEARYPTGGLSGQGRAVIISFVYITAVTVSILLFVCSALY